MFSQRFACELCWPYPKQYAQLFSRSQFDPLETMVAHNGIELSVGASLIGKTIGQNGYSQDLLCFTQINEPQRELGPPQILPPWLTMTDATGGLSWIRKSTCHDGERPLIIVIIVIIIIVVILYASGSFRSRNAGWLGHDVYMLVLPVVHCLSSVIAFRG